MSRRGAVGVIVMIAAGAILASCSSSAPPPTTQRSKEYFSEAQYGPASPRVVAMGATVPKGGGRQMVGAAYRVAGKTYIPRVDKDYTATGLASWYGEAFHGRLTANGEVYDVNGLTAAHPTMPLPSYARVTNLKNGRSIIVRVNDRGPFARNRVIDLSKRVADILGYRQQGTTKVRVDYMGPADMDGLDHEKLMASYREGGENLFRAAAAVQFASAQTPAPRLRPVAYQQPAVYQPAFDEANPISLAPAGAYDPLGPLIMRTGFGNGYAAQPELTGAQRAADALARNGHAGPNLQIALNQAAAKRARELGLGSEAVVVIQVGTFSDPANARRAAQSFARFGTPAEAEAQSGNRSLVAVRVIVSPSVDPNAVISAAADMGLKGAFVVR